MSESSGLGKRIASFEAAANASLGVSDASRKRAAIAALQAAFRRQNMILVVLLFLTAALVPALPFVEDWMAAQATLVIIYILLRPRA